MFVFTIKLSAQEVPPSVHTLEECLVIADRLNPAFESQRLANRMAAQEIVATRRDRLPVVEVQSQVGYQFGRSIDPTTNSFADQAIAFNTTSLVANWTVFGGGRQRLLEQGARLNSQLTRLESELLFRDVQEQIIIVYGRALAARATLEVQLQQLTTQEKQLAELATLIQNGVKAQNESLEPELRKARLEREIQITHQQYQFLQRELAARIGLEANQSVVPKPIGDIETENPIELKHFSEAPEGILSALRTQQIEQEVDLLSKQNAPSISLFGQLGTNFSGAAQELVDVESVMTSQTVILDGVPTQISANQLVPIYGDQNFISQLRQNFNQVVGVRLQFPLFDGGRSNQRRQVLQLRNQMVLADQQTERRNYELRQEQRLYAIQESEDNYKIIQMQLAYSRKSLQQLEIAFQEGGVAAAVVTRIQDEVALTELELIRAKYNIFINRELLRLLD